MSEICLTTGETNPEEWEDIDSDTQDLLVEWYNIREKDLSRDDLELLAELFQKGNIEIIECPECGTTCYEANPDNWGDFQGTGVGMEDGIFGGHCGDCYTQAEEKAKEMGII